MRESLKILALHGFLGKGEDWAFLEKSWQETFAVEKVELQEQAQEFSLWCEGFKNKVSGRPILLGYSMGGRLAMHLLCAFPECFRGAVLVSCQSGMPEEASEERAARMASDETWARRFEGLEAWEAVLRDWNSQGVFMGGGSRERSEFQYDRSVLAGQLRTWSLGRQKDLLPKLAQVPVPILWISGEKDMKYVGLARRAERILGKASPAEFWVAPGAGHRVPWDQPELFKKKVEDWIFRAVLGR